MVEQSLKTYSVVLHWELHWRTPAEKKWVVQSEVLERKSRSKTEWFSAGIYTPKLSGGSSLETTLRNRLHILEPSYASPLEPISPSSGSAIRNPMEPRFRFHSTDSLSVWNKNNTMSFSLGAPRDWKSDYRAFDCFSSEFEYSMLFRSIFSTV